MTMRQQRRLKRHKIKKNPNDNLIRKKTLTAIATILSTLLQNKH